MVFSELTNNNTVTIYTKNEVNTYFVKQIESNDISTNVILEDYNYMITVPKDLPFYILHIHNDISIITCDNRIIELINTVKRLTKNSVGLQIICKCIQNKYLIINHGYFLSMIFLFGIKYVSLYC